MFGRFKQVAYFFSPRLDSTDRAWALDCLNAEQQALFAAMAQQDQAHVVRVARRLSALQAPGWVLEAALLHDCGKPADYGFAWRVAGVLAAPALAGVPASPRLAGWRRHLQTYRWHDAYGLALAEQAGTSPEAIALMDAYAREDTASPWVVALMAADDAG